MEYSKNTKDMIKLTKEITKLKIKRAEINRILIAKQTKLTRLKKLPL